MNVTNGYLEITAASDLPEAVGQLLYDGSAHALVCRQIIDGPALLAAAPAVGEIEVVADQIAARDELYRQVPELAEVDLVVGAFVEKRLKRYQLESGLLPYMVKDKSVGRHLDNIYDYRWGPISTSSCMVGEGIFYAERGVGDCLGWLGKYGLLSKLAMNAARRTALHRKELNLPFSAQIPHQEGDFLAFPSLPFITEHKQKNASEVRRALLADYTLTPTKIT